ncbi:MAG TPA: NAD(P)H-dependent oxidoreductase [Gammaproteobacteria bacterium]
MHKICHIAVVSASLRKRSCNRKIAQVLGELAPPLLRLEIVEISRLSPYTLERDLKPPAEWRVFRRQISAADGLLFLAPENSRAVPGALANALNIAAHSEDRNAWEGKPCAIVNVPMIAPPFSRFPPRRSRTRRLRQALSILNVPVMQTPRIINDSDDLFDVTGKPVNPATQNFLSNFMSAFENWIRNFRH